METNITPQIPSDYEVVDKTYSLYGKTIRSNYPMPLPEVSVTKHDITITFDGLVPKPESLPPNSKNRVWGKERNSYLLRYYYSSGHMHEFRFSHDGSVITITQSWPEWRDTLFPLMNAVMAAAISLQGGTSLHGSSLVYSNRSTLIMGISGAGKSTLSAALAAQGLSLHSDDIAFIEWTNEKAPVVMAGYPMIKINPALKEVLEIPRLQLIPIIEEREHEELFNPKPTETDAPLREKWLSAEYLPGGFYSKPASLQAMIILDERNKAIIKPIIKRLKPVHAAMAITEHIYARDWLNKPGPETVNFCTGLAKTVPVYKVNMPDNPELIHHSASIIREKLLM